MSWSFWIYPPPPRDGVPWPNGWRRWRNDSVYPSPWGGGISSADQAVGLVRLGADKISLNTAAVRRPELITGMCARLLGDQAVVCAVDVRREKGSWEVVIEGGRTPTGKDVFDWIEEAASRGAGEILLTSMDRGRHQRGGTMRSFCRRSAPAPAFQ